MTDEISLLLHILRRPADGFFFFFSAGFAEGQRVCWCRQRSGTARYNTTATARFHAGCDAHADTGAHAYLRRRRAAGGAILLLLSSGPLQRALGAEAIKDIHYIISLLIARPLSIIIRLHAHGTGSYNRLICSSLLIDYFHTAPFDDILMKKCTSGAARLSKALRHLHFDIYVFFFFYCRFTHFLAAVWWLSFFRYRLLFNIIARHIFSRLTFKTFFITGRHENARLCFTYYTFPLISLREMTFADTFILALSRQEGLSFSSTAHFAQPACFGMPATTERAGRYICSA